MAASPRRGTRRSTSPFDSLLRRLRNVLPPLPAGERVGVRGVLNDAKDYFKYCIKLSEYLVVPEPQHSVALTGQVGCALSVCHASLRMLTPIQFNDQVNTGSNKVTDERTDRTLTIEFCSGQSTVAQLLPERDLRIRLGCAEVLGEANQALIALRQDPSPQPSPQRGEGVVHMPAPSQGKGRYFHSCCEASRAPSARAWNLAQTTLGWISGVGVA
jgi:hypothetical protein